MRSEVARTEVAMGTVVTINVISRQRRPDLDAAINAAMDRAFGWFQEVEARCTRFHPQSELMQLCARPRVPVTASPLLFEAIRFALLVAEASDGAFDPTVGHRMETLGFNRNYRTDDTIRSAPDHGATYRDIQVDPERETVTLLRPLTLDLGAVAKGLAIDTAARELAPFLDFAIDAGGDLYLGGTNQQGEPWSVGIRDPRNPQDLIASLRVSNHAVCTSGDYERPGHLLDPRTGASLHSVASATVIAPGAMLADALATAAFVLGPVEGIEFLQRQGMDGLLIGPDSQRYETRGLRLAA